jgi:serine/threonine-protein kinase
MRRRFGDFELDAGSGRLVKNGAAVPLRVQPFQVLAALVASPGDIVSFEQLKQRVWPNDTTAGFESGLNNAISRLRAVLDDESEPPRFIEAVPDRGYRFIADVPRMDSVALLPLVNRGSNADDYFCDGLTGEIFHVLSHVEGLRLAPPSAVQRCGDPPFELELVGKQLKVAAVLEGFVQRSGGRARISVHLVSAADGSNLWSHTFDTEWKHSFSIPAEVASSVSRALALRYQPRTARTPAGDAYLLYLKGCHWAKRQSLADLHRALEHFDEAMKADAQFAPAFQRAAMHRALGAAAGWLAPRSALAEADRLAADGLALDSGCAAIQFTLAVLCMFDLRPMDAVEPFERALDMEPDNPVFLMQHALYFTFQQRHAEAIAKARRAVELDPFDAVVHQRLVECLYCAREFDQAIEAARAANELQPDCQLLYSHLALALAACGRTDDAWLAALQGRERSGHQPLTEGHFGYVAALAGRPDAHEVLAALKSRRSHGYGAALPIAWIYLGLGDWNTAFQWLETAAEEREPYLAALRVFPGYDPVRDDARFAALLNRLNL